VSRFVLKASTGWTSYPPLATAPTVSHEPTLAEVCDWPKRRLYQPQE